MINGASEINLGTCKVVLLENGIIENIIHPGEHVDVNTVHQLKKANLELANGKKYTLLVTSGHLSSISKEAMTEIAAKGFNNSLLGKALLVSNLGHRMVGNFYLRVKKPAINTRIFDDREMALEWLRELLSES